MVASPHLLQVATLPRLLRRKPLVPYTRTITHRLAGCQCHQYHTHHVHCCVLNVTRRVHVVNRALHNNSQLRTTIGSKNSVT